MSSLDVTTTYPNHDLGFVRDEFLSAQHLTDQEMVNRQQILAAAKKGDKFARWALSRFLHLGAWWNKELGGIVGSIDAEEIAKLEARGIVRDKLPVASWRERGGR